MNREVGDDSTWALLGSREVGQLLKDFEQDHLLSTPLFCLVLSLFSEEVAYV